MAILLSAPITSILSPNFLLILLPSPAVKPKPASLSPVCICLSCSSVAARPTVAKSLLDVVVLLRPVIVPVLPLTVTGFPPVAGPILTTGSSPKLMPLLPVLVILMLPSVALKSTFSPRPIVSFAALSAFALMLNPLSIICLIWLPFTASIELSLISPNATLVTLLVPALIPVTVTLGEFGTAPPLAFTKVKPLLSITVPLAFTLSS